MNNNSAFHAKKLVLNMSIPRPRNAAFTLPELLVVVVVMIALALFLLPALQRSRQQSSRITCVNNLKQIGTGYRLWGNDHGGQYPALAPQTNGGWRDLLYLTNASTYVWTNYARMANKLGQSTEILACPADERKPANTFSNLVANTNISYFVGVSANDTHPQSLLGGDRNLGPGTTPDPEYGFSPANGKGNDVIINGPVCWSLKMHSRGNPAGAGNILLGDGSVQQITSGSLNGNWVKNTLAEKAAPDEATNVAGARIIFP
jgi:type II secretory pathway pseudopilin PulG